MLASLNVTTFTNDFQFALAVDDTLGRDDLVHYLSPTFGVKIDVLVREMHVCVPLVGEAPSRRGPLENDLEHISIVEGERGLDQESVNTLRVEVYRLTDLLSEIIQ